ncbi:MAG: DNA polymerase I [Nitrospirae bacterium]|nr:DNA polymerase I [Nitrospirota bacterium]
MPDPRPTLYLVDGNSYIYRAFYAIRNLSTSKGFPSGAAYGFTAMLMKVADEKRPDYLGVAFDPKGPTTRNQMYDRYKATRPPMPDTLVPQIPYIHKIVEAFNIPVLLMPGIEADDVIAATARKAASAGFDVTIVTGDKDLFQLIDEHIKVYDTMKEEVYGPEECEEKFGVPPSAIPELLGLMGDSSDNIPGVPGIGPKTAVELIKEFGSIEGVLANVESVRKPKLRENLKAHTEDARLSRRLVELMRELPEEVDLATLKRRPQDSRALTELFRELEFSALMKHVTFDAGDAVEAGVAEGNARPGEAAEYITVSTEEMLSEVAAKAREAGALAVDTETTSTLPMLAEPVGISLCFNGTESYYVPFGHVEVGRGGMADLFPSRVEGQLDMATVVRILRPLLEDPAIRKFGHNIKYDIIVLRNMGIEMKGVSFDSMVGAYLINPGRSGHNLENTALEHLGRRKMTFADAAGSGAKQVPFSQVDIPTATRYSAEDAHVTFLLAGVLEDKLRDTGLTKLFAEMELPLIGVLARIEMDGVFVDTAYLGEMSKEMEGYLDSITRRIYMLAGKEFNINSPKQLGAILFEKLGLPTARKTKTGFSTDEEVLTTLALSHELPAEILNYRELYKLKSTYVDALPRLVNRKTGRLHTSLNQAVAATGRLSSSDPNLQNIPIRGEWGGRIRRAFAAPPGRVIISADYSQVELRIMAHLAGDESFIESFRNDEDIHTRTASEIFGVPEGSVDADMRRKAKAINFGIIYGISSFGLSNQIGVHPKEAQRYIDAYFERHGGVRDYIARNLEEVRAAGYSTTIFGRKRAIPELASDNKTIRSLGERLAINTPIQGSAADLIKVAMIDISRTLASEGLSALMVLQVHDELVFESPVDEADKVVSLVRAGMEGAVELSVPLKVDAGMGPNWGEAH